MNIRLLILFLYTAFFSLYFLSCANITQPTGGPKDSIPPIIISSEPIDQTINYQEDELTVFFDEIIKVGNIKNEMIITPDIENYDYKILKNRLVLRFKDGLQENTTYTFNLTGAVQDITEGNAIDNAVVAFSTGSFIDSLSVSGRVAELFTNKTPKGTIIGLYPINDTISVFKHRPQYFTRADEAGNYNLNNIKYGEYRLYAFEDKNNDRILQTVSESYAFEPTAFYPVDSTKTYELSMVKLNVDTLSIRSARTFGPFFDISLTKSFDTFSVQTEDTNIKLFYQPTAEQKGLRFYNPFPDLVEPDSTLVNLWLRDTVGFIVDTTLYAKFKTSKRKPAQTNLDVIPASNSQVPINPIVTIKFSKPITSVSDSALLLYFDSLHYQHIPKSQLNWNPNYTEAVLALTIDANTLDSVYQQALSIWDASFTEIAPDNAEDSATLMAMKPELLSLFELHLRDSAFQTAEGDYAKKKKLSYQFISEGSTGSLSGFIDANDYAYYKMQLIEGGKDVIAELTNPSSFSFSNLKPTTYKIRFLIDTNGDGLWSLGNILANIPPDAIQDDIPEIKLRANFEIDLETITINASGKAVDSGE